MDHLHALISVTEVALTAFVFALSLVLAELGAHLAFTARLSVVLLVASQRLLRNLHARPPFVTIPLRLLTFLAVFPRRVFTLETHQAVT